MHTSLVGLPSKVISLQCYTVKWKSSTQTQRYSSNSVPMTQDSTFLPVVVSILSREIEIYT